ncbi:MAG: LysM peptidoglycan-binding domain-containing protein [Candidatus Marinimicrobia bacterium]|nr:LysM peptidoglycan-binding domain-containing protein [Candidatus Neomarinimicrobiota bacterium]
MRSITIIAIFLLIISCAKKPEELISPEPPSQTDQTTETQRLSMESIDSDLEFNQTVEDTTYTEITAETTLVIEPAEIIKEDSVETVQETPAFIEDSAIVEIEEPQVDNIIITPPIPKPEIVFADSVFEDYMIKRGDFLSKIAKQEYGDWLMWKNIYSWNRDEIGSNPNLIYPYHFLDLLKPAGDTKKCPVQFYDYSVSKGETLWSIAGKVFGDELAWIILYMDNEDLIETTDGVLSPGMKIKLRKKLDPCS